MRQNTTGSSISLYSVKRMLVLSFVLFAQVPIVLLMDAFRGKERHESLYEQLRIVAQRLNLLQPEDPRPVKSVGELPWRPERLVAANMEAINTQKIVFTNHIQTDLIEAGEKGKVLVLPRGRRSDSLTLCINHDRYALIGGVVELLDEGRYFVCHQAFTVDKVGIVYGDLGRSQFVMDHRACFDGVPIKRDEYMLPRFVEIVRGKQLFLRYEYLIYEYVDCLTSPYEIQHLGLSDKLVPEDVLNGAFMDEFMRASISGLGISLVRFIQLWKAIAPDYVFKDTELKRIDAELEVLKDEETEKKAELLLGACRFIRDNIAGHNIYNYPFSSILMAREPEIEAFFFAKLGSIFDPQLKVEEEDCDHLSNKLLVFSGQLHRQSDFPYVIEIPCRKAPNMVATFKLIATFNARGQMITFGTDHDGLGDEEIFQSAVYDTDSFVKISNSPFPDLQSMRLTLFVDLLIYQHFSPGKALGI